MELRRILAVSILAIFIVGGCSDSSTGPEGPVPAVIEAVAEASESGIVGEFLADSLTVLVKDHKGAAVSGVEVSWRVTSGAGSLSGDATRTDAAGLASVAWKLGTKAGPNQATATVGDLTPVTFNTTGIHDEPVALVLPSDSIFLDAIGDTVQLSAEVVDQYDNPIGSPELEWSSSDTQIVSIDSQGVATSHAAGVATIEVKADTMGASVVIQVEPLLAKLRIHLDSIHLTALGDTVQLSAAMMDRLGHEVDAAEIVWTARDTMVATVSETGLVTAQGSGTSMIIATSGEVSDSVPVWVIQEATALSVSIGNSKIAIGDTVRLIAEALDANGAMLPEVAVSWSSTDTQIATVDETGLALGRAPGHVVLRATVEANTELSAEAELEVTTPDGLYIIDIEPAILTPSAMATISGGGFGATAAEVTVTIQGISANVTRVSDTKLSIILPPVTALECQSPQETEVEVIVAGQSAKRLHPLVVAQKLPELEVGEYLNFVDRNDISCNEVPQTGGKYLVSVYNTSTAVGEISPFRLSGKVGKVGNDMGTSAVPSPRSTRRVTGVLPRPLQASKSVRPSNHALGNAEFIRDLAEASRQAQAHLSILERNHELMTQLGPPQRTRSALGPEVAAAPAPLTVGSIVDLRVPDWHGNTCTDYVSAGARVVYAGSKAVVLEDTAAHLAGTMDTMYTKLGTEFEETMLPIIEEYFGDPLAYDTQIGGGGRILMFFTPVVNSFEGLAGFVSGANLYPPTQCPASNEAQIFYAIVPTSSESGYGSGAKSTIDSWYRSIRSAVIHEVKHITSHAERISRGHLVWEESWLEESTARMAEELWAREVFGYTHKGRTGYRESIYCEVRPSECGPQPLVMWGHFIGVHEYMSRTNTLSPLGRVAPSDWTFYGSGWLLVRWTIDNYADSESEFLRALTQETRIAGVQNLRARTGTSLAELLGPWSLSLYWDRDTTPGSFHPSWDLYDIFAGLHRDFPDTFAEPYPLQGRQTEFGAFDIDVSELRGGSAALFILSGEQASTQILELLGYRGGVPPLSLRLAIMRVE